MRDDSFKDFMYDQLAGIGPVEIRRMFGAYGLYHRGTFFGILHQAQLYFKTDDATRKRYVECGMGPFRPRANQTLKNYYEVPPDVVDDREVLAAWAHEAIGVAASGAGRLLRAGEGAGEADAL